MQAQTRSGQLRLAGLLHPFRWGASAPVLSSRELAAQLGLPLGIQAIESAGPLGSSAHQLSLNQLGAHAIAAWVGTPITIVGADQPRPCLYLVRGGWLELNTNSSGPGGGGGSGTGSGSVLGCGQRLGPGWLLYLGGGAYRLRCGSSAVVAIGIDPDRLAMQIEQLAAASIGAEQREQVLRRAMVCGPAPRPWGLLVAGMGNLLELYEHLQETDPRLVGMLELAESLERLLAALLLAAALGLEALDLQPSSAQAAARDAAFAALLMRIRANLAGPLDLAALERYGQKSRRKLQLLFQERLGCTPMQWVRHERLLLARLRLANPRPNDTVASIARASGYASASQFSTDFRREFQSRPSELLRAARQQGPGLLAAVSPSNRGC
jgi:AraC-like DNA-binding protein